MRILLLVLATWAICGSVAALFGGAELALIAVVGGVCGAGTGMIGVGMVRAWQRLQRKTT